jgi:outer membrane protein TolC
MKNKILNVVVSTLAMGAVILSCSSPAEKVKTAEEAVTKADSNLVKAQEAYRADVVEYKELTDERINANYQSIAEFKARVSSQKKEAKAEYEKKIADLENKNSDMKRNIDNYKEDGKENWELFKIRFNKDMEELGKSFESMNPEQ